MYPSPYLLIWHAWMLHVQGAMQALLAAWAYALDAAAAVGLADILIGIPAVELRLRRFDRRLIENIRAYLAWKPAYAAHEKALAAWVKDTETAYAGWKAEIRRVDPAGADRIDQLETEHDTTLREAFDEERVESHAWEGYDMGDTRSRSLYAYAKSVDERRRVLCASLTPPYIEAPRPVEPVAPLFGRWRLALVIISYFWFGVFGWELVGAKGAPYDNWFTITLAIGAAATFLGMMTNSMWFPELCSRVIMYIVLSLARGLYWFLNHRTLRVLFRAATALDVITHYTGQHPTHEDAHA